MKILPLVALLALCAVAADAARTQLLRIHEVTQQEYNDLLRLTRGESQVSESRLLRSSLSGLASSYLPSFFVDSSNKPGFSSDSKRYPLCVVSSKDRDNSYGRHITWKLGGSNNDDKYGDEEYEGGYGGGHGGGHDGDKDSDAEDEHPVVNCIVVVKDDKDDHKKDSFGPKPKPGPYDNYEWQLWNWYNKWIAPYPLP